MASPMSVTIGCSASTARGTSRSPASSTAAAASAPASKQASVSRLISPKPEKRHMPCGTLSALKTTA